MPLHGSPKCYYLVQQPEGIVHERKLSLWGGEICKREWTWSFGKYCYWQSKKIFLLEFPVSLYIFYTWLHDRALVRLYLSVIFMNISKFELWWIKVLVNETLYGIIVTDTLVIPDLMRCSTFSFQSTESNLDVKELNVISPMDDKAVACVRSLM